MTYQEQIKAIEDYMDASLGVNGEITKKAEEAVKEMKAASGDLISRQAAIDAIGAKSDEIYKTKMNGATFPHGDFFQAMAYAETIVKNLPSAQPDHIAEASKKDIPSVQPERKPGHWKLLDNDPDQNAYECSACGNAFILIDGTPKENNYNYCQNCGARMEPEGKR